MDIHTEDGKMTATGATNTLAAKEAAYFDEWGRNLRHLVYLAKYRHAKRDWDALQVTLEGLSREVKIMFPED